MTRLHSFLFSLLLVMFVVTLIPGTSIADAPAKLNYQGLLTDGAGQPVTGQKSIKFSLYTVLSEGTAFWTETQDVTFDSSGRFSATLGSSTAINKDQFTGTTYLGIKVGTDPELAPRQLLTSVAYALQTAAGVPTGGIIMWSGTVENIPAGWALCDGNNGTPNLGATFIVGVGSGYAVGATGGVVTNNIQHTHTLSAEAPETNATGNHSHHIDHDLYSHIGDVKDDAKDGSKHVGSKTHGHKLIVDTWGAGNHSHTVNSHSHGGATGNSDSSTLENLPPYYALAYIMKL